MIEAKVIEDSIDAVTKTRITTLELKYPRFILAEFNTHRVFSRNSSSSRAIPVWKMMKDVLLDPVYPSFWGENQKGMQAAKELSGMKLFLAKFSWRMASFLAVSVAGIMNLVGLHKQIANRIIEPWMWTKTIVTATEWGNFFDLRCHKDAQPEIRELAWKMAEAIQHSIPKELKLDEWHLPYVREDERETLHIMELLKISTARCARVSYLTHDGKVPNVEKDIKLHERLVGSIPRHSSPAEHQATPTLSNEFVKNFKGWKQYRSLVEKKLMEKSDD